MMKKIIISLSVLLSYSCGIWSQEASLLDIPKELVDGAHSVVVFEHRAMDIWSTEQAILKETRLIAILNKESDENIHYVYYDEDTKVKSFKGTIYNSFGAEVRKVRKEEIRDFSLSNDGITDTRVQEMDVQYAEYPYLLKVELEMKLSGLPLIANLDWHLQGYDQSVLQAKYVLRLPPGMELPYQVLNSDMLPLKEQDGQDMIWTFSAENLPAIKEEPYSPPSPFILPKVLLFPESFMAEGYTGDLSSWNGFGLFMQQLYEGRQGLPESLKEEIRPIIEEASSKKELIDRLYAFMQTRMRYVSIHLGIGGWQPFPAAEVEEKRYGDCKALTNYMCALLQEAGIASYPVLIERRSRPSYLPAEDFTFSPFNHVVLYVPEEEIWLECTSNSYPANYLGYDNEGRTGLLISESGGRLIETPMSIAEDNRQVTTYTVQLQEDGSATIIGKEDHYHHFYQDWQLRKNYLEPREWEEYFLKQINPKNVRIQQWALRIERTETRAEISYELEVPRYGSKAGKRLFVPLNGLHPWSSVPSEMEERKQEVSITRSKVFQDSITLQLPVGLTIESLPKDMEILSPFGTYQQNTVINGDTIHFTKRLLIRKGVYKAEKYPEFRDFFKQVSRAESVQGVFVIGRS